MCFEDGCTGWRPGCRQRLEPWLRRFERGVAADARRPMHVADRTAGACRGLRERDAVRLHAECWNATQVQSCCSRSALIQLMSSHRFHHRCAADRQILVWQMLRPIRPVELNRARRRRCGLAGTSHAFGSLEIALEGRRRTEALQQWLETALALCGCRVAVSVAIVRACQDFFHER